MHVVLRLCQSPPMPTRRRQQATEVLWTPGRSYSVESAGIRQLGKMKHLRKVFRHCGRSQQQGWIAPHTPPNYPFPSSRSSSYRRDVRGEAWCSAPPGCSLVSTPIHTRMSIKEYLPTSYESRQFRCLPRRRRCLVLRGCERFHHDC